MTDKQLRVQFYHTQLFISHTDIQTFEALTSRVNSLSATLRAGYLSVRTAEGASEKQSSLKARLKNGLTYLLTYHAIQQSNYMLNNRIVYRREVSK